MKWEASFKKPWERDMQKLLFKKTQMNAEQE